MNSLADNTQNDLLSVTAFFSALLHVIIILGVSFKLPDIAARSNTDNALDVVLVNNFNKQNADDAELMSSEDNAGGGDDEREGSTPLPWKAISPSPIQSVDKTAQKVTRTRISPDQIITAKSGELAIQKTTPKVTEFRVDGSEVGRDKLTTRSRMLERERLLAKISQDHENYQKRPNRKFLGPNTVGDGAAKYLLDWKNRVVRVGNANYPINARTNKLYGTLIISIEINRNGTIHSIKIIKPSQHKLLNDSAKKIIRDASPFAVFPDEEFFAKTDILVITRAIHFLPDNSFDSTAQDRG